MSEEEIRKIAKEYTEMYFTKGIDSTKIFKYVDELEKKVEQLENIRKEAIEYVKSKEFEENFPYVMNECQVRSAILNILNKGDNNGK